ncbi:hypothetical protein BTR23_03880 [Alkalihalophilus pseudofirmus]|nr:hypothetical protein BTR23_03880 [Alkalihalophilus pseudofirmus]
MYFYYKLKRSISNKSYTELLNKLYYKISGSDMGKFNLLLANRKYFEATKLGENLYAANSDNITFLKKMAFCCYYSDQHENANSYLKLSLEHKTGYSLEELLNSVQNQILEIEGPITSKYVYIGGFANFGFIEHYAINSNKTKTYITKITSNKKKYNKKGDKESFFYQYICQQYPELINIVPRFIDFKKLDAEGVSLLTVEKINGAQPTKKNVNDIVKISDKINSISLNKAITLGININYNNANSIAKLIHKKSTNKEVFSIMNYKLKTFSNPSSLSSLISRVENLILGIKLYRKIIPETHYSFCHNDFHRNNIIVDDTDGKCYVIDWDNYTVGLKGWDMIYFFGDFQFTFEEILQYYLNLKDSKTINETVWKIFFVYLLIFIWIDRSKSNHLEDKIEGYILPAVEYIEDLSNSL